MRHLRILVKKGETVVKFDEPLVIEDETMTVKHASVFWDYLNLTVPTHIIHGTKKVKFYGGYWTVNMIIEKLKKLNIEVELLNYSCKIKITPVENLSLLNLAPLLGFSDGSQILKGKSAVSDFPVNINLGLKYFNIKCNIVDKSKTSLQGKRDNTIVILPITTTQSLKGSVTYYDNINSKTELNSGIYNELTFSLSNNVGEVLLELIIK